MGDPQGPPLIPVVHRVLVVPVPKVVQVKALLIHGVDCGQGVGVLLVAVLSIRVRVCAVHYVR